MPDLLQLLKGNEIWLDQAKQWAPKEVHKYFDEQIEHCEAMSDTVLKLSIDSVKAGDLQLPNTAINLGNRPKEE